MWPPAEVAPTFCTKRIRIVHNTFRSAIASCNILFPQISTSETWKSVWSKTLCDHQPNCRQESFNSDFVFTLEDDKPLAVRPFWWTFGSTNWNISKIVSPLRNFPHVLTLNVQGLSEWNYSKGDGSLQGMFPTTLSEESMMFPLYRPRQNTTVDWFSWYSYLL